MTKTEQKAETRMKLYREFWKGFEDYLADNATTVKVTADRCGGRHHNWMRPCNAGRSGFNLVAGHWLMKKEIRATLRITEETGPCYEFFDLLEAQKEEIEKELDSISREREAGKGLSPRETRADRELTWERAPKERIPPKKRGKGPTPKIYLRRCADLYDKDAWSEQYAWLLAGLEDLHRVFEDRIGNLPT